MTEETDNTVDTRTDLQRIQANLNVPKNQFNEFGKFSYRNCEDILQALKPLLDELNCTLTLHDEIIHKKGRFYIRACATFKDSVGNAVQVAAYAREPDDKRGMDEMQLTGAASSYARKYALSGLFLLDDNKDADSVLNVTEAETDAFTDLIEAEEGAKLFLMQANDSEKYLALVKRAMPKAGKVAFKENLSDLIMKAVADAQTCGARLKELVDSDDAHGIREVVDELSPEEKQVVWRQLTPQEQDHVRAIMKGE